MDPELTELKSYWLVRVFKHPDSSVTRSGRQDEPPPTASSPRAWVQTWGNTLLPRRNAWTREPSELLRQHLQTSLHQRSTLVREPGQLRNQQNPGTRQLAKKTSNLTTVEKERRHRFEMRLQFYLSFSGGSAGPWEARCLCFVFLCLCVSFCSILYIFLLSGNQLFNKLKSMRGDAGQVADVRNRRASIFLPINPSKIITIVSGLMHCMP